MSISKVSINTNQDHAHQYEAYDLFGSNEQIQVPINSNANIEIETNEDHSYDLFACHTKTIPETTKDESNVAISKTMDNTSPSDLKHYELFGSLNVTEVKETITTIESPRNLSPKNTTSPKLTRRISQKMLKVLPRQLSPHKLSDANKQQSTTMDNTTLPTRTSRNFSLSATSTVSSFSSQASDRSLSVPQIGTMTSGMLASKVSGNAIDIIAVKNTDGDYFTTSWHVQFSWSRFRSNLSMGVGDIVRVFVNGIELKTKMRLLEKGRCIFTTGGLTPPNDDLRHCELHENTPNHVRFEHYRQSTNDLRCVDARLYVWGPNESVCVADLDGTITISDVEGHIRTLRLGQYDFMHTGACDFFTKLEEVGLRIVYLTARPIDWATASRVHLDNATQQTHRLPPGPLITNPNGLTGALLTEVIQKNPHIFKAQALNEVQLTLIHAGRTTNFPVFVTGFGNRSTDVVAYSEVGMKEDLIFLIDPSSSLKAVSDPRIYASYSDPNVLLWLLPRLKHCMPIEKAAILDDYTVRELVLAEEREMLLIAERQARRIQELQAANVAANRRTSRFSAMHV